MRIVESHHRYDFVRARLQLVLQQFALGSEKRKAARTERTANGRDLAKIRLTILVVDDDEANLALARALLEADGFTVVTATDAMSTFDALKDVDPALILMDIQLPGMDGWELTRRLKRNIATSHIPIIAVTAYGQPGDLERAREVGFVEFVAKPVSTRELPAIIRRHLRS
jgi:two-component system cell cycle response regulator DivK